MATKNHPNRGNANQGQFLELPGGKKHLIPDPSLKEIARWYTDHPMHNRSGGVTQFSPKRNEHRGFIEMPLLGSGYDDVFLSAIVKGTIHGQGLTPVIDGELSGVLRRFQMMTHDWITMMKSSFESPMNNLNNFLAMAEGGEGINKFISNATGGLLSQNSGFIFAQLPLHRPVEEWSDWGGRVEPLLDRNGNDTGRYIFDIDANDYMRERALWSLDNIQIDPTGDPEYPFWIRKVSDNDVDRDVKEFPIRATNSKKSRSEEMWILIHKNYGTQIVGEVGSVSYDMAGYWSCPSYTYFGDMGVMNAMVMEYNQEGFFNSPPEGLVVLTGADDSEQFGRIMTEHIRDREANNSLYYPGVLWMSVKNTQGKVFSVPFKQPKETFNHEEFIRLKQRRLALAFGLSLNFVTLEIGVGAVHQANVADNIAEITGISFVKNKIQQMVNTTIAPRRVLVQVSIPSSSARAQQATMLNNLANGIRQLQDAGAGLSSNQVVMLTEKIMGITVPTDEEGDLSIESSQGEIE